MIQVNFWHKCHLFLQHFQAQKSTRIPPWPPDFRDDGRPHGLPGGRFGGAGDPRGQGPLQRHGRPEGRAAGGAAEVLPEGLSGLAYFRGQLEVTLKLEVSLKITERL